MVTDVLFKKNDIKTTNYNQVICLTYLAYKLQLIDIAPPFLTHNFFYLDHFVCSTPERKQNLSLSYFPSNLSSPIFPFLSLFFSYGYLCLQKNWIKRWFLSRFSILIWKRESLYNNKLDAERLKWCSQASGNENMY